MKTFEHVKYPFCFFRGYRIIDRVKCSSHTEAGGYSCRNRFDNIDKMCQGYKVVLSINGVDTAEQCPCQIDITCSRLLRWHEYIE